LFSWSKRQPPDQNCQILMNKFDLMNKLNFDLMIKNSTSWKSWILISWNSTSWPPLKISMIINYIKKLQYCNVDTVLSSMVKLFNGTKILGVEYRNTCLVCVLNPDWQQLVWVFKKIRNWWYSQWYSLNECLKEQYDYDIFKSNQHQI